MIRRCCDRQQDRRTFAGDWSLAATGRSIAFSFQPVRVIAIPAAMKISVIMPNYNGARFLRSAVDSVLAQREAGVDLEFMVIDGASTDGSLDLIGSYGKQVDLVVSEPDHGPAQAINKGLARASGDVLAWLNADDRYHPHTLKRVAEAFTADPRAALMFGRCLIIDEQDREIRRPITRFKELFFPLNSRFTIQSINYISQPATFFRRSAFEQAGPLREDLHAAWDYEFFLRLWRHGGGRRMAGGPLADFRWHPASISGAGFQTQFREEFQVAAEDAGRWSPQAFLHWFVRWGIVGAYELMRRVR
jgi:glycosyltransferase involved in cell wall biosynthesis